MTLRSRSADGKRPVENRVRVRERTADLAPLLAPPMRIFAPAD